VDSKTRALVVGPPNLYPMLARAPSDEQTLRMVARYVANASELAVNAAQQFGMPSISRSSSAFADNSYWRGRAWGPMNMLVYLSLLEYRHLAPVKQAMTDLARQSEATFLVEWTPHHRVMENFNSQTGAGCDVGNAIPFYHWGGLNALVALMEAGPF
jgi:glycogen debranching enzyme